MRPLEILFNLINDGKLVDEGLKDRHLFRVEDVNDLGNGRWAITIERHPHVLGARTVGEPSDFFLKQKVHYIVNEQTEDLDDVVTETIGVEYDIASIAEREVESFVLAGLLDEIENAQTEKEAVSLAEAEFKQGSWLFSIEEAISAHGLDVQI
ncbi:hypothetical protein [Desulfarculus baarsii]|uniref:hypothetical protein n=1 Tax=Desulfarculus baarsii TaxID=453230 RepID=UPI0011D0AC16|nr:hypothetical protein [Desulfarculus baarsii]